MVKTENKSSRPFFLAIFYLRIFTFYQLWTRTKALNHNVEKITPQQYGKLQLVSKNKKSGVFTWMILPWLSKHQDRSSSSLITLLNWLHIWNNGIIVHQEGSVASFPGPLDELCCWARSNMIEMVNTEHSSRSTHCTCKPN